MWKKWMNLAKRGKWLVWKEDGSGYKRGKKVDKAKGGNAENYNGIKRWSMNITMGEDNAAEYGKTILRIRLE